MFTVHNALYTRITRAADDDNSEEKENQPQEDPGSGGNGSENRPGVGQNCVVQCVFQRLGLVSDENYY